MKIRDADADVDVKTDQHRMMKRMFRDLRFCERSPGDEAQYRPGSLFCHFKDTCGGHFQIQA